MSILATVTPPEARTVSCRSPPVRIVIEFFVNFQEPRELLDWLGMVFDAKIDVAIIISGRTCVLTHDE